MSDEQRDEPRVEGTRTMDETHSEEETRTVEQPVEGASEDDGS